MSSDIAIPLSREEVDKLDLGALISREVAEDHPDLGYRSIDFEFERGTIRRTEYYAADTFMEANAARLRANDGARWKDGRVVASVPMNIWAKDIAPRMRDGNTASLKRWLNDSRNRCFRTFKGRV